MNCFDCDDRQVQKVVHVSEWVLEVVRYHCFEGSRKMVGSLAQKEAQAQVLDHFETPVSARYPARVFHVSYLLHHAVLCCLELAQTAADFCSVIEMLMMDLASIQVFALVAHLARFWKHVCDHLLCEEKEALILELYLELDHV